MIELNQVLQYAPAAVAGVLAITLHEAAHGYAAWALGDDTARLAGRLSLNPLRHVDPFGTIVLPALLLLSHTGFVFGWAKPVPVAAWKFRHPRQQMALVAIAGPLMNFFLAWLGALSLHFVASGTPLGSFATAFILFNLVLGLFNLLPIPPLDGGRIMVGLLPLQLAQRWARLERAGLFLVILAIFIVPMAARQFGYAFDPVQAGLSRALGGAVRVVLALAGIGPDVDTAGGDAF